jgi:ABC-type polysaccharide/polyol phosphate export permease
VSALLEHVRELYRHRALLAALVWRDLTARYRGSILGYFWTLLNPLLLLGAYSLVFTRYTQAVDLDGYPVFLLVGLLPWLWLSGSVALGANSVVGGANLITRVCFPPQVLPAVTVLSTLVNFLLALPVAILAGALVGLPPGPALALLPVVVALELVFLYAVALALASLTVRFRDVGLLAQSVLTIWFFLTPVTYPLAGVPEDYRALMLANPAMPLLVAFQDILFFRRAPDAGYLLLALAWTTGLLLVAVRIFDALRDSFAEEV